MLWFFPCHYQYIFLTFSFLSLAFTLSSLLVGSVVALCYVNFLGFRKIERVLCGIEGEAVEP